MGNTTSIVRLAIVFSLLFALSACGARQFNHGYVPTKADLEQVVVGKDTRETVAEKIGRPAITGAVDDRAWYYVQSRFREFAWQEPKEIDRQVLAISFDARGKVANIERFGLKDGHVITLSRRITASSVNDAPLLRQLLGNIGQALNDQLFGGSPSR